MKTTNRPFSWLWTFEPTQLGVQVPFSENLCWSTRRVSDCYYPIKKQREHSRVLRKLPRQYRAIQWGYAMLLSNFGANIAGAVRSRRRDFAFNWYLFPADCTHIFCWESFVDGHWKLKKTLEHSTLGDSRSRFGPSLRIFQCLAYVHLNIGAKRGQERMN